MSTTFQVRHPGAYRWSKCSAPECGASIVWTETANGRRMCLDRLPDGLFAVAPGELVRVSSDDVHWATCKARAQFAKGRK